MGGGAVSTPADAEMVGTSKLFSRALVKPLIYAGFACFGALLYGYDGTYFTAILETPAFQRDYGQLLPDGTVNITSSQKSLLASIVQAGEFCGALSASFIGDYSGRKGAFLAACAFVTLGVIIQIIPAGNVGALTGGRLVLGMGVGVLSNATPLYLSEVAPTRFRGAFVSSWQLILAIGQVVGACVGQGSHDLNSTWAYRIPIIVNLAIVAVIVFGMTIIPESPRWLLTKDRDEKAMAALRKINSGQSDPEYVAAAEFKAFAQARDEEARNKGGKGWSTMLQGVELRKFVAVLGILIGQQIGGVQFIFSYTTTFFNDVGVANPFLITIVIDIIEVVGVLCSFLIVNRFARRTLILSTSVPMFISLFVVGGLGTIPKDVRSETQKRTIAAMIAIYVYFFNLAWGPLAWAVASELSVGANRQKIMSIGTACFWLVAFVVTFTLPYLYDADKANLGAQIGWIYGVGTIIAFVFVYFVIPETKGRSLEEISEMLEDKVPTRKWPGHVTRVSAAEQGVDQDGVVPPSSKGETASYEENADEEIGIDKSAHKSSGDNKDSTAMATHDV